MAPSRFASLLSRLSQDPERGPDSVSGTGRTAELRRKFAAQLDAVSRRALRPPVSEVELRKLQNVVAPRTLPSELVDLFTVADGEVSEGLFVPDLSFHRAAWVAAHTAALQMAEVGGPLARVLDHGIPLFKDVVNHSIVLIGPELPDSGVHYIDVDSMSATLVSHSLSQFIERLVRMHEANIAAGHTVCPGDLRDLNALEQRIAREVGDV
jgi:hypothetical protein